MICYICSPYKAYQNHTVEDNVESARAMCKRAIELGYLPLAPHLYLTTRLDDNNPAERERGLQYGIQMLELCNEIWVCGEHTSQGMEREIAAAKYRGIPIKNKRYLNGM